MSTPNKGNLSHPLVLTCSPWKRKKTSDSHILTIPPISGKFSKSIFCSYKPAVGAVSSCWWCPGAASQAVSSLSQAFWSPPSIWLQLAGPQSPGSRGKKGRFCKAEHRTLLWTWNVWAEHYTIIQLHTLLYTIKNIHAQYCIIIPPCNHGICRVCTYNNYSRNI